MGGVYITAALWREEIKSTEAARVKLINRTHAVHSEAPQHSGEGRGCHTHACFDLSLDQVSPYLLRELTKHWPVLFSHQLTNMEGLPMCACCPCVMHRKDKKTKHVLQPSRLTVCGHCISVSYHMGCCYVPHMFVSCNCEQSYSLIGYRIMSVLVIYYELKPSVKWSSPRTEHMPSARAIHHLCELCHVLF